MCEGLQSQILLWGWEAADHHAWALHLAHTVLQCLRYNLQSHGGLTIRSPLTQNPPTILQGGRLLFYETLWFPGTESHSHPLGEREEGGVRAGARVKVPRCFCVSWTTWFLSLLLLFSLSFQRVAALCSPSTNQFCGSKTLWL